MVLVHMCHRTMLRQAYDVEGLREVAVKVHQLNGAWTEAKKESYVKHATREFNIHRELKHPRIVALLDIFELDSDSFAMVMEFCSGGDLDTYLKEHVVSSQSAQPQMGCLLQHSGVSPSCEPNACSKPGDVTRSPLAAACERVLFMAICGICNVLCSKRCIRFQP